MHQRDSRLHVMQKQTRVSSLRYALSRKNNALRRAAKLVDEYKNSIRRMRHLNSVILHVCVCLCLWLLL